MSNFPLQPTALRPRLSFIVRQFMGIIATLVIVIAAAILLLLPFETSNLRHRATHEHLILTRFHAVRIALFSISASFVLALACFGLVMFGPAYALGGRDVLPWLTVLPAIIVGFWVARRTSRKIISSAFSRLESTSSRTA
ncbi:MAG: hypothetical protein IT477_11075 [Rhodanobacteraceae bacterium]|nr:hypothetical protein [Rhodanobacteraceae bacterium]MDL1870121.1 hypothetical protein [Gammaproteobacteria bacterium PRO6]